MRIFPIILPFFLLFASTAFLVFYDPFYAQYVTSYDQHKDTINNLQSYFLGGELSAQYSDLELLHLPDVRGLFFILYALIFISLISILVSFFRSSYLERQRGLFYSGVLGITLVALLFTILLSFHYSFIAFHKIFFTNNYWQLPPDSLLITIFPESFFAAAFQRIILYSLVLSLVLIALSIFLREVKYERKLTSRGV